VKAITDYMATLQLRGGDHDGEAFKVLPRERRFINGALKQSGDSALTVARGDGKSALVAALACAVVDPDGPLHGPVTT
jgi:predicted AAA+ superfamily ATPase